MLLCGESRLNPDDEPRVKRSANAEAPKATHPFFWAGYMLIDSGESPKKPTAEEAPVLKVKKPAEKADP